MENKKHKWYDVIVAWANGEEIQYRCVDPEWRDYVFDGLVPGFCNEGTEWRIKPNTITKLYRMALVRLFGEVGVYAVDITDSCIDNPAEYDIQWFVRWVGEPVEVEIEL